MFPFLSDTQKLSMSFLANQTEEDKRIAAKWAPPTEEEKEAIEAQYREEYGDDYIEDEELTPNQVKAWMNRINANQCQ